MTTGFSSGSLVEVELSPTGDQVSHAVRSFLAGCTGAGHAVYVRDAVGLKIVGTCYSSGNYFIETSRF